MTIEVLGLGNSLVDILAYADDAYLDAQEMVKGAMTLIDEDRAEPLYAARVDPRVDLRRLGRQHDRRRRLLRRRAPPISARSSTIRSAKPSSPTSARPASGSTPHPAEHGPATGRCFVYVTPDGERTMNTYLGASTYLSPPDVDEALVREAKVVYLEGYMWDRPAAKSAFQKAGDDRPRGGRARRADAVGFVLRRPLPRRVHRPHADEDGRHDVRQHRRGAVALRDAAFRRGARRAARPRACCGS